MKIIQKNYLIHQNFEFVKVLEAGYDQFVPETEAGQQAPPGFRQEHKRPGMGLENEESSMQTQQTDWNIEAELLEQMQAEIEQNLHARKYQRTHWREGRERKMRQPRSRQGH